MSEPAPVATATPVATKAESTLGPPLKAEPNPTPSPTPTNGQAPPDAQGQQTTSPNNTPTKGEEAGEAATSKDTEKQAAGPVFEIEIDGEKKSLSGNELVDYTREKIEAALSIHDRYQDQVRSMAENPLHAALDAMTQIRFGGDRRAAYQELVKLMDSALSDELKYRSMPEDKRAAMEAREDAEAARAELNRLRETEEKRAMEETRAQKVSELLRQMSDAAKEAGIEDSREIRERMVNYMREDQAKSLAPDARRAAQRVKEYLEGFDRSREEVVLKRIDLEALKKHRPELLKQIIDASTEEVRRTRDEKKAETPARREKEQVGRILPSALFTKTDW